MKVVFILCMYYSFYKKQKGRKESKFVQTNISATGRTFNLECLEEA
jgi:hypothetical protein